MKGFSQYNRNPNEIARIHADQMAEWYGLNVKKWVKRGAPNIPRGLVDHSYCLHDPHNPRGYQTWWCVEPYLSWDACWLAKLILEAQNLNPGFFIELRGGLWNPPATQMIAFRRLPNKKTLHS